jgi:hypothetical protein
VSGTFFSLNARGDRFGGNGELRDQAGDAPILQRLQRQLASGRQRAVASRPRRVGPSALATRLQIVEPRIEPDRASPSQR